MSNSREQSALQILSGQRRGPAASALRAALSLVEPLYASVTLLRNTLYHHNILASHKLPRPTISVGNLTTGGTGKTPVVRFLANHLRSAGHHPAILLRGYKAQHASSETPLSRYAGRGQGEGSSLFSDEAQEYQRLLNTPDQKPIPIHPNPDRIAAAHAALQANPQIDCFLLDDAFQHRRAARDFDLLLINATSPFGFNHVLPRGLLREPLAALRRAHAILLTHADQATHAALSQIESTIRRYNPSIPIFRADHVHTALRIADTTHPLDTLRNRCVFAFCGIGSPDAFLQQVSSLPSKLLAHRFFPDHHAYTPHDLADLHSHARRLGADLLLTTEKDFVKLALLPQPDSPLPIARLDLGLRFHADHESLLLQTLRRHVPLA